MKHSRRRHRSRQAAEMNITSFMNLMVILVPFLLITAVFSRLAIMELNLPTSDSPALDEKPPELSLEIIVRRDVISVADRNAGLLTRLPTVDGDYDYDGLTEYLKRVKSRFPQKLDAALLLESDVSYDVLVQVMDAVRVYEAEVDGDMVRAELFPEIAIGDAPRRARGG
ncbi:MAG: biopolymer transporter ExbD [Gammaproteobacteria bacterium]